MAHTTNYYNTLIEVAEDCPVTTAEVPKPQKNGAKTIALYQYEMISEHPYRYTSDEVIFEVHTQRKEIPDSEKEQERHRFFSKGQPCMRSSPLGKRFGWGVHSDADGKIAIYPIESEEYQRLANDDSIKHTKAMRSKRA
jgi:hypothetical protein